MCLYVYVPFVIFSYFLTVPSLITTIDTYMMKMMMMMIIIITIIVNRVRLSKTCFVRRI